MGLHVGQMLSARGYITSAKYLHGTINDFERNIGYHFGRLGNGFFIAHLLRLPETDEFDLAGYSITPEHRFVSPKDMDIKKLKTIAREAMIDIGCSNLVKVFPKTGHDQSMEADEQYPFGQGGIPQWKLIKELPMRVFKEVEAGHRTMINLIGRD